MLNDSAYPALLLNADFRPLSVTPISTVPWKDAVKDVFQERVNVVAEYDMEIRSPNMAFRLPSVIVLRDYVHMNRRAPLTRWNLFLAHAFTCAYCSEKFETSDLTFEHVRPRSRGGVSEWENLVPACAPCNNRRGNRDPKDVGMVLRREPFVPDQEHLNNQAIRCRAYERRIVKEWVDYLYWMSEIDP